MADVFISHASEDRERVRPLAAALEARGFSVWWDRALAGGEDYARAIRDAFDEAKAVVVVWSALSIDSPWVREEAARAGAENRLAPVLLDAVEIPSGFGAKGVADFTAWSGREDSTQMDELHAAVQTHIEGRAAPAGRGLGAARAFFARIKPRHALVGAVAAMIAFGLVAFAVLTSLGRDGEQERGDFPRLADHAGQGELSGDQALALARQLRARAFAGGAKAEIGAVAGAAFEDALTQLLQDPDRRVRAAALRAAAPDTRQSGLDALWTLAEESRPSATTIQRFYGALGLATGDPRALAALERARDANPQDRRVWRMAAWMYAQAGDERAARGAALVGEGLQAAADGDETGAAKTLEAALGYLKPPHARAFVLGQLGDAAAKRDDWPAAEKHYRLALDIDAGIKDRGAISIDAAKLARAQAQLGEAAKACATLARARQLGVETPAIDLAPPCRPSP